MSTSSVNSSANNSSGVTTTYVNDTFQDFLGKADKRIIDFMAENTNEEGALDLSAAKSLELQMLMSDQSIAAQTATSTLKSVKDSIMAAARNI